MFEVIESATFKLWRQRLRDRRAVAIINARIRRISLGNLGNIKSIRAGVRELKINYGPGYRIYFLQEGRAIIVLLTGGDKSTQSQDINRAIDLAREWEATNE